MLFTINILRSTLWSIRLIVSDFVYTLPSQRILVLGLACAASLLGLRAVLNFFAKGRRLVWLPSSARPTPSASLSLFLRIFCGIFGKCVQLLHFSAKRSGIDLTCIARQTCVPSEGLTLFQHFMHNHWESVWLSVCSLREGGLAYRSSVSACSPYIPNASKSITHFSHRVSCGAQHFLRHLWEFLAFFGFNWSTSGSTSTFGFSPLGRAFHPRGVYLSRLS